MNQQPATKTTYVTIWFSMLIACVIYYFIPRFMNLTDAVPDEGMKFMTGFLKYIAGLNAVIGFFFLFKAIRTSEDLGPQRYLNFSLTNFIVAMANFEAIAIYGLVICFLGVPQNYEYFIYAGGILILITGMTMKTIFEKRDSLIMDLETGSEPDDEVVEWKPFE